ncbi:S-layer homology domain-containing protein [Ruminococcus flavefaciens]|uniref:S-layer homology domain-containing protein n=1 Tax=Ruminococcus flavefaciens TaxID=1265 RepID=UPI0004648984|nr:S-layer homology domain-containing protein [Ruminococcus flavefaciens]
MLYNYEMKFKKRPFNAPSNALDKFDDRKNVSSWALTPMIWAISQGILSGKGNNKLAPNDIATRAVCVQIIYKYSGDSSIYIIKSSNGAKVRNSASISGTQIGALAKSSVVTYDQSVTENGYIWYHIISVDAPNGSWDNYSGWVANV